MFKRILGVSLATVMALTSTVSALALTPADGLLTATGDYANSTGSVIADKDAVDINGVVGKDTTQGKYSQYDVVVDGYTGTTMDDTTSETEVYATVLPMFMTRIPKVLVLSAAGECEFAVSVKGDISGAQTVLIKPEAEQFDMVEVDPLTGNPIGKKDNVPATISVDDIDWTYATDFKTVDAATYVDHTGSINAMGLTAGSWRGTFNFLIGLDALGGGSTPIPDDDDVVTDYTVEEIEADPTLFMIGATRPEYVVANFNDDFTEVVITKNGEDSDGVMASLMNLDTEEMEGMFLSPMSHHADTLTNAIVKDGVVNIGAGAFVNSNTFVEVQDSEYTDTTAMYNRYLNPTLTVSLSDTVLSIDEYAFFCSSLKSIKLSENLTTIKEAAFGISTIKNIELPESLVELEYGVFASSNIRSIRIPSKITTLTDTFYNCRFLEEVDLSDATNVSFNNDYGVFYGCFSLANVELGNATESDFLDSAYASYLYYENEGITMTKEMLENGSVLFYLSQDDKKILATGYLLANTEYYIDNDVDCIKYLYCEENVKLHVPSDVSWRCTSCSMCDPLEGKICFSNNVIYSSFTPATNLTIYGAAGSDTESLANTYGHTFIAE